MDYYLYFRDADTGRIVQREELASCASDEVAMCWMKNLAGDNHVELWQQARLVAEA